MSFQAYLDTKKAMTGKTLEDFMKIMKKKGLLKSDMKAGVLVKFLAKEYKLGHGHAMAVWLIFKNSG